MATLVNVVVQSAPIVGRKKSAIARNAAIARTRTIEARSSENMARAGAAAPWPGVARGCHPYRAVRVIVTTRRRESQSSAMIASTNGAAER